MWTSRRALILGLAWSLTLGAVAPAIAAAPCPPPPIQVEKPPPPLGPQYIWIAGHWDSQSGKWTWVPGSWVEAQGVWIPGRYVKTAEGCVYQEGRWKKK